MRFHRWALTPRPTKRLWAVLRATSILIAACTSTATRPNPSTAVCLDAAKVRGLYEEWAHAAADIWVGDSVDLAQVAASLRTARETSLELARATAAYPVVAEHFQDAADSYLKVPPIPPDASLDAMSRSQIDRLEESFSGTGNGVYEAIDTLNNSDIPFCLRPALHRRRHGLAFLRWWRCSARCSRTTAAELAG